jgi:hypothetical protein
MGEPIKYHLSLGITADCKIDGGAQIFQLNLAAAKFSKTKKNLALVKLHGFLRKKLSLMQRNLLEGTVAIL